MSRRILAVVLVFIGLGCKTPETVEPKIDTTSNEVVDAGTPDTATAEADAAPELASEIVEIGFEEETTYAGGLTVKWTQRRHKHGKNTAVAMWSFLLSSAGESEEIEIRADSDERLVGEGSFGDTTYRIERIDYDRVSVKFIPGASDPLTDEEADQLIEGAVEEAGLDSSGGTASSEHYGMMWLSTRNRAAETTGRIYLGLYTRTLEVVPAASD